MTPILCLMGPTASGKTQLAVEMVQRFPCEIISVDSAMIYRAMDIGTAKPTADILKIAPHRLINLLDAAQVYSAGQFCQDALKEIEEIQSRGKVPLLVGGTMLYFRVLQRGIAPLPFAHSIVREKLQAQAKKEGWKALHAKLTRVDPQAASRISVTDQQRIQRALEVYEMTGKPLSILQADTQPSKKHFICFAIAPSDRKLLHQHIEDRLQQMFAQGFVEEVERLFKRGDLHVDLPSMRTVGYRQIWAYLAGKISEGEMRQQALFATRQLAKRQWTWLRSWPAIQWFDSEDRKKFLTAVTQYF